MKPAVHSIKISPYTKEITDLLNQHFSDFQFKQEGRKIVVQPMPCKGIEVVAIENFAMGALCAFKTI